MIQALKYKMAGLLKKEDQRSQQVVKNIVMSFGVKGGSILIGLMLVPLTINYVSPVQYGIWLTISSIVSWMSFFDIGMGNGLRNNLTAALATREYKKAKKYVSSTYMILSIISLCLLLLFAIINPFIEWRQFLNIPATVTENISFAILIVVASFCVQFVVQLINVVLTAAHEPAVAGFISFLGQLGVLGIVFLLTKWVPGNLIILVTVLTTMPIVVLIAANIFFYKTKFRFIAPSLSFVDFSYLKNIFSTGGSFFIIQLGALILFQTDNIIITKFIGPTAVTEFNVVYKLFSVVIMGFTILMTPYWSAFTDAFTKSDFQWMRSSVKRIRRTWLITSMMVIPLLALCSDYLYKLWIGDAVSIPQNLTYAVALYTIAYTGMSLNSYFLNGIGKIKLQQYLYIVGCFVNIPLGIMLAKRMGTAGVVLANVAVMAVMMTILWIQSNKILKGSANGLWNK